MSRHPYGPDELDRDDPSLDRVADRLERYADERRGEPSIDLAARIRASVHDEPAPAVGWWAIFGAGLRPWRTPARVLAATAILVAAVVGAMALGELAERVRQDNVGTSPEPSVHLSPTPTPTPTGTPSPTPSPTPTPTSSPSATPMPTATNDDDEVETPEPSESDNSGPGGGGGDSSGPGGGG